jgi:hypothetical protein
LDGTNSVGVLGEVVIVVVDVITSDVNILCITPDSTERLGSLASVGGRSWDVFGPCTLTMAMQTSRTSRLLLVAFHLLLSADQTASFASSILGSFADRLAIGADASGGSSRGSTRSRGRCSGVDTR